MTTTTTTTINIPEDDARAVVAALVAWKDHLEKQIFHSRSVTVTGTGEYNQMNRDAKAHRELGYSNGIAALDRVLGQMGARL